MTELKCEECGNSGFLREHIGDTLIFTKDGTVYIGGKYVDDWQCVNCESIPSDDIQRQLNEISKELRNND